MLSQSCKSDNIIAIEKINNFEKPYNLFRILGAPIIISPTVYEGKEGEGGGSKVYGTKTKGQKTVLHTEYIFS